MNELLKRNLKLLQELNPEVLRRVEKTAREGKRSTIPNSAKTPSLGDYRATTFVYFGIDRGLPKIINELNGENNLIVVEENNEKLVDLLAETENENMLRPERVQWVFATDMLHELHRGAFVLGKMVVLNPEHAPRSALTLAVLRFIKELALTLNRRREENSDTYLTMVTYNRLPMTKLTLERLLKNTKPPFKLVIVDNNSTDGTPEWLAKCRDRYSFIERVFLFDDNLGIGRALNNGMVYALSRSTKVGRVDNDVLVPPRWLEDMTRVLRSELKPLVVGGCITDDDVASEQIEDAAKTSVGDLKVYHVDFAGGFLNLYPPDIFDDLGFFPEQPLYGVEDGGLCKAARDAGENVVIVDNVKVEHLPSIFGEAAEYIEFKEEQLREFAASKGGVVTGVARLRRDAAASGENL